MPVPAPDLPRELTDAIEPLPPSAARSIGARVLARLPEADQQRAAMRAREHRQRLCGLLLGVVLLCGGFGPTASNFATRALAWLYGADVAWKGLVTAVLGGLIVVPTLSALCLLALSLALWYRLVAARREGC